eukprot:NODE_20_length_44879_cov_0.624654.p17 type:complete len:292 gc:universal NODE_20_length_44879_cov_0.624654:6655-7530(+)
MDQFLPENRYSQILKESDGILRPKKSIGVFINTAKLIYSGFNASHSLQIPLKNSKLSYSLLKEKYFLKSVWSFNNETEFIASSKVVNGLYATLIGSTTMNPPKASIAYSILANPINNLNIETSVSTFDNAVGTSFLIGNIRKSCFGCEFYYLPKNSAGGVSFGFRQLFRSNTFVVTYTPIIGQVGSSLFKPLLKNDIFQLDFTSRIDANLFSYDSNLTVGISATQKLENSSTQTIVAALGHWTGLSLSYIYHSQPAVPALSLSMYIPFQWSRLEKFYNQKPVFSVGINIEL